MKTQIKLSIIVSLLSLGICLATQSAAAVFTQGGLSVTIADSNGAIDAANYNGADYFNSGTAVSDFGFQNGSDTGTFVLNTTTGGLMQAVTSVPGSGSYSGSYIGGGANISFVRSYSLVTGSDVLRVTTSFVNLGGDTTVSYFDTFDPDPGGNFTTANDVFNQNGALVGQAWNANGAVMAGSDDSRVTVASGGPFRINSGTLLNNFFSSPVDGEGSSVDSGLHIGLQTLIAAGDATSFTYYLAFGSDAVSAESAFASAIPEPSTYGLLIVLVACVAVVACRRK